MDSYGCSSDANHRSVRDLVTHWFDAVAMKLPIEQQRAFFAPGVKLEAWNGTAISLEQQIALHDGLTDEVHSIHALKMEPLADGRAGAIVDLHWEATKPGEKRIRADIGEDWAIERGPDGRPRFARYLAATVRYLPGSAKLDLD